MKLNCIRSITYTLCVLFFISSCADKKKTAMAFDQALIKPMNNIIHLHNGFQNKSKDFLKAGIPVYKTETGNTLLFIKKEMEKFDLVKANKNDEKALKNRYLNLAVAYRDIYQVCIPMEIDSAAKMSNTIEGNYTVARIDQLFILCNTNIKLQADSLLIERREYAASNGFQFSEKTN